MKFTFLTENKTDHEGIVAEHGLSIYIETEEKTILFDTGATDTFYRNADVLGIDLGKVDLAVISHGHYDHTGGVPAFCERNSHAPVYIHKDAFRRSHGFSDGKIEDEMCGIRWTDEQRSGVDERLIFTDGSIYITDRIGITGTVPVGEGFEPSERFYYFDEDGKPLEDDMSHEQCLVIRENDGLYVFSGCSHRGVIPAIEAAKAMFPGEKIAVFVAGMHLFKADQMTRARVIDQVMDEDIIRIMPVHCTGMEAICDMKYLFKDRCVIAQAGDSFDGCQG